MCLLHWQADYLPLSHQGSPYIHSEVKSFSRHWLFATPWTIAYQDPQSMGFSRQEYWSGLPFPSPDIHSKTCQILTVVSLWNGIVDGLCFFSLFLPDFLYWVCIIFVIGNLWETYKSLTINLFTFLHSEKCKKNKVKHSGSSSKPAILWPWTNTILFLGPMSVEGGIRVDDLHRLVRFLSPTL